MKKKTTICIVGESGTGKSALARYLKEAHLIPTVVSHTTRPMREGERDGVDHIFISDFHGLSVRDTLAYTYFGGHYYWTTTGQITEPVTTYVIDEKGLDCIRYNYGEKFDILSVRIHRDTNKRIAAVGLERVKRDEGMYTLKDDCYDVVIANDGDDLNEFLERAARKIIMNAFAMLSNKIQL